MTTRAAKPLTRELLSKWLGDMCANDASAHAILDILSRAEKAEAERDELKKSHDEATVTLNLHRKERDEARADRDRVVMDRKAKEARLLEFDMQTKMAKRVAVGLGLECDAARAQVGRLGILLMKCVEWREGVNLFGGDQLDDGSRARWSYLSEEISAALADIKEGRA